MKTKGVRIRDCSTTLNEQVRAEIQIFLQALNSYGARVAADPDLSFDQHCRSLMRLAGPAQRRTQKRRTPNR